MGHTFTFNFTDQYQSTSHKTFDPKNNTAQEFSFGDALDSNFVEMIPVGF